MRGRASSNSRQSAVSGRRCRSAIGASISRIARSARSGRVMTSSIPLRMMGSQTRSKRPPKSCELGPFLILSNFHHWLVGLILCHLNADIDPAAMAVVKSAGEIRTPKRSHHMITLS